MPAGVKQHRSIVDDRVAIFANAVFLKKMVPLHRQKAAPEPPSLLFCSTTLLSRSRKQDRPLPPCIRREMSCYMQMLNSEDADMTMPSGTETSRPPVPTTRDELLYRLRQQSLLGEFGRAALQTRDIRQILQRATELCAQGLEAPFAKVLEYIPDEKRLLVRAGVGWPAGTIDHVSLGADVESPAGYAFHTGKIVISNHLQEETRFRTPQFLADHGVRRAINVLVARGGEVPMEA